MYINIKKGGPTDLGQKLIRVNGPRAKFNLGENKSEGIKLRANIPDSV